MPDNIKNFEAKIFDHETTNRTDFGGCEIKPNIKTTYKEKGTCLRIRPLPLKDTHALTDWRVPNVPFDLFGKAKDILRTNPHDIQKTYAKDEDLERKTVQMSRPRIVMTPGAALDDIEDRARKILIDNMYMTMKTFTMREADARAAVAIRGNTRAPFPDKAASSNPIKIPKLQPPFVSPEWRMDSVQWDNRQIRAYCNPTERFWLQTSSHCQDCKITADREAMKKFKRKH